MSTRIAVYTTRAGQTSTHWAACLAWALAETRKVLLVDCDMEGGTIADLMLLRTDERGIAGCFGDRPATPIELAMQTVTHPHRENLRIVPGLVGMLGFRFALAGRAASRRLRVERAFLGRLRDLRDRMAIGNQSLDTALQEIGRNPGPDLEYVLAPLARGGSVLENIVAVGVRARSPVVENACAVLLWTRSRSLDALIEAIDQLLLPVGEAQLAVQEEASVTLAQQRAVTIAMSVLMLVMFIVVVRVDSFRSFYQSGLGNVVLVSVVLLFSLLVGLLGVIVRVRTWTRWDLRRLAEEQERLGAQ